MEQFARIQAYSMWFKGHEGAPMPPGADIIQIALEFHCLPHEIEAMPVYWLPRIETFLKARAASVDKQ